jgi:hypothetical protein
MSEIVGYVYVLPSTSNFVECRTYVQYVLLFISEQKFDDDVTVCSSPPLTRAASTYEKLKVHTLPLTFHTVLNIYVQRVR